MTVPIDGARCILRNRMALVGWIFMSIWMAILMAFTYIFKRDGGVPGQSFVLSVLFMAGFWIFGLVGTIFFFKAPVTSVYVRDRQVTLRERWLLRAQMQTFELGGAESIFVRQEKDSEGDPYFICYLRTPEGREVRIKEAHLREIPEKARADLLAALGLAANTD